MTALLAGSAAACSTPGSVPRSPILPAIADANAAPSATPAQSAFADDRAPTIWPGLTDGARATGVETADGFVVNLNDVDVRQAAQIVLGDLLGESFQVDPGVAGKLSLKGSRPLKREVVRDLFASALQVIGATIREAGGIVHVVRLDDQASPAHGVRPPGFGVTAIPLEYIGLDTARTLLQSVRLAPDAIRTDAESRTVFVLGEAPARALASETIEATDTAWLAATTVGLFPVYNTTPAALIEDLGLVLGETGRAAPKLRPLDRLNAILAVADSPEALRDLQTWIRRLDVSSEGAMIYRTYFLDSGKAEDVASVLDQLFGSGQSMGMGMPPPQSGGASATPAAPKGDGSPRIVADKFNNALLVLGDRSSHRLIQNALRDIDRQPAQVLVDATIVEVTLTDKLRYGVQWFFETNGIGGGTDSGRGGLTKGTGLDADGVFPGFNYILESGDATRVAIDALSAVTNVTVRSSPSLMVLDNQSAKLRVGDRVPVVTRQASSVNDPNPPLVSQIEFRDTGVLLGVTPHVSSTGIVTLEIDQEVSNVSETASTSGPLAPTISQRRIESTVAVRSGQTLVLGGLIDEARTENVSGLPILSQLPVVGALFGGTDNNARRTELIVFLTPRVLRTPEDATRSAQELRDRMDSIRREDESMRLEQ